MTCVFTTTKKFEQIVYRVEICRNGWSAVGGVDDRPFKARDGYVVFRTYIRIYAGISGNSKAVINAT